MSVGKIRLFLSVFKRKKKKTTTFEECFLTRSALSECVSAYCACPSARNKNYLVKKFTISKHVILIRISILTKATSLKNLFKKEIEMQITKKLKFIT